MPRVPPGISSCKHILHGCIPPGAFRLSKAGTRSPAGTRAVRSLLNLNQDPPRSLLRAVTSAFAPPGSAGSHLPRLSNYFSPPPRAGWGSFTLERNDGSGRGGQPGRGGGRPGRPGAVPAGPGAERKGRERRRRRRDGDGAGERPGAARGGRCRALGLGSAALPCSASAPASGSRAAR